MFAPFMWWYLPLLLLVSSTMAMSLPASALPFNEISRALQGGDCGSGSAALYSNSKLSSAFSVYQTEKSQTFESCTASLCIVDVNNLTSSDPFKSACTAAGGAIYSWTFTSYCSWSGGGTTINSTSELTDEYMCFPGDCADDEMGGIIDVGVDFDPPPGPGMQGGCEKTAIIKNGEGTMIYKNGENIKDGSGDQDGGGDGDDIDTSGVSVAIGLEHYLMMVSFAATCFWI